MGTTRNPREVPPMGTTRNPRGAPSMEVPSRRVPMAELLEVALRLVVVLGAFLVVPLLVGQVEH